MDYFGRDGWIVLTTVAGRFIDKDGRLDKDDRFIDRMRTFIDRDTWKDWKRSNNQQTVT